MKLLTAILAMSCFFPLLMSGQDSTYKELGLNATPFVNQYLDFGSGNGEFSSPYMLTYEQKFGKIGGRFGVGIVSKNRTDSPVNGTPTEPEFHQSELGLNTRLGVVFYKTLSRRWDMKYGVDAIFSIDKSKNWTEVKNLFGDVVKTTNLNSAWESGISPFVFVEFHLTDHFSLATELLGKSSYEEIVAKTESTQFPQFNTRQQSTAFHFNITPPTALYFIFRF